jgi:D-3-phosphoglycerate dehydrogenase
VKKVVVIDAGYECYDYERDLLVQLDFEFIVASEARTREAKIAAAQGALGLFVRGTEINAAFLDAVPTARYIVRYGVGYDNVDLGAASERGVKVSNVQGYANHSVSDHALALIYACLRGILVGTKNAVSHFGAPPATYMPELKDATLGIVGLGRIGGTLCQKAQGLFKRVVASDPYIPRQRFVDLGAEPVPLDALLAGSHFISLHCNLTEETTNLVDTAAIATMRHTPILVNTARGPVINESALLNALNSGQIHAAGLDVYWDEPPGPNQQALLDHPRVVATGHYAWYSTPAAIDLQRRAARNMVALLRGEIPEDCLNP